LVTLTYTCIIAFKLWKKCCKIKKKGKRFEQKDDPQDNGSTPQIELELEDQDYNSSEESKATKQKKG